MERGQDARPGGGRPHRQVDLPERLVADGHVALPNGVDRSRFRERGAGTSNVLTMTDPSWWSTERFLSGSLTPPGDAIRSRPERRLGVHAVAMAGNAR